MADEVTLIRHPAKFSETILATIADLLPQQDLGILDPFAGVGRVHDLVEVGNSRGFVWWTYGIELEPEWASQSRRTGVGNALFLANRKPAYDAIVTSPCYGNRMADKYAGDSHDTPRHTYRTYLGRDLSPNSSAVLQWGEAYRVFHRRAWAEATRVSKPGAAFVLNVKDHIRKGKVARVTDFHIRALRQLGWQEVKRVEVDAPGQRHGENGELRMDYETVVRMDLREMW